ncbi:MAG: T9SS type A sorting domain-containing protein [Bacteroidota bacterium]
MKKTLLSIFGALAVSSAIGQVASPSWSLTQNAAWPKVSTGVRLASAVDANVFWATGYDGTTGNTGRNYSWFTKTSNGGALFTSGYIFASPTNTLIGDTNSFKIASLDGVSATTCWVASYLKPTDNKGAIHRTTNGGTSWQNMTPANMYTNTASFCNIVHFLTPQIGITMGDPNPGTNNEYEIWRTADGGNTWSLIPGANIPNPASAGEFGLTGVSTKLGSSNIWFGTNEGRIFRTTDAGLTWNVTTLDPTSIGVNEIAFANPLNGYAWLFDAAQTLQQYNTNDGGVTWTLIPLVDPNLGLNDMSGIPGTSQFASCGAGSTNTLISYSTNNGVNWTTWGGSGIQYLTVDFANNTVGWAGTFSDPTTIGIGGILKYTGPAIVSAAPPTAAFNAPPSLCLSGPSASTTLNNTSTGSPVPTYTWSSSPAAVFSSSLAASPTVTFTGAGSYTITLLAANSGGTNSATQVVVVQACTTPTAAFSGAASVCVKQTYTVSNTTTGAPTPTYSWTTVPSASVIISNPLASAPSFTFNTAGVYTIALIATNASGTNFATQTVSVNACPPTVNFTIAAAGCTLSPLTTANTTTSAITPITYTWSALPSGSISNVSAPAPTITFSAAGVYSVTLKASNVTGSTSVTQTVSITDCVGIQENLNILNAISVFPNPSNGVFNITLSLTSDNINYVVTNILGSTISSGKFNTSKNVDLSSQAKGIYFITFETKGNKITKKIVID